MLFTDAARALLQRLEGCRLTAYRDRNRFWTIGFGHKSADVHEGLVWTQDQADAVFAQDLDRFVIGVDHCLANAPRPLSGNQFSALVVFAYNVGLIAFAGSTALRDVLNGHLELVPHELARWVHVHDASGVPVFDDILVARRAAEIQLWNTASA
jgi:lysozyme